MSEAVGAGEVACERGPYCAIGRVVCPEGPGGLLVYVKSSLSGDERDYIIDYARRSPAFLHDSINDQFFSEEQLEMYRTLGFHMVQALFGDDRISFIEGSDGFAEEASAPSTRFCLKNIVMARVERSASTKSPQKPPSFSHFEPIRNLAETLPGLVQPTSALRPTGSRMGKARRKSDDGHSSCDVLRGKLGEVGMTVTSIQSSGEPDRRSEERSIMIMRVGLLEQAGEHFFCLVRNVSSAGISVKLYSAAARLGDIVVRIGDENPISGQIVWINNMNAGIAFEQGVDPEILGRLRQKLRPVRRRSVPRVKATSRAALHIGGRIIQAVLRDISSLGARVTTSRSLEIGAQAFIRIPDLPEIRGYVRWTECLESGLVFETPIPMQVIGEWIAGRLRLSI